MTTPDSTSNPGVFGIAHVPLPTAAQAAAADDRARTDHAIPDRVLMESAGRAAALVLQRLYPHGRVVGVAGSGHNGGDLVVMLRCLHAWGRDVAIIAAGSTPPDPHLFHGTDLTTADSADDAAASRLLAQADVIVDGLLGTGAQGAPRGRVAEWIGRINQATAPVLALDVPSGVDATSGGVAGEAVRAATTVTFGWPKLGLMLHPGRAQCGRLIAVEIGFPEGCVASDAQLITPAWVRAHLRERAPSAHKGTAGRLLVLAGREGMAGAAAIATAAAIRAGAGLLRIASASANRIVLQTLVPEATFLDMSALENGDVDSMHAVAAGPGLGTDAAARAALLRVLELTSGRPALLDADALNICAEEPGLLRDIAAARPVIITPHARELSRITRASVDDIVADAPAAARAAAHELGAVVLLKGQPTLIALTSGHIFVNSVGSSDVATAGMGDQLAGTIGAMLAGGHDVPAAAALGLFLSGRAADVAALGRSLTPGDVSAHLAHAIRDPGPALSSLGLPFVTFDQPARR